MPMQLLQKIREALVLLLLALLPFHALLVTVGTMLIAGPGHAPLAWLALWKEGLLAVILLIAVIEYVSKLKAQFSKLHIDSLDLLILALLLLSLTTTALGHNDWKLYLFGFKYDFIPLVSFFLLRRTEWSEAFAVWVQRVVVGAGSIVALYGFVALFLPMGFFQALGYSDLHSLYLPGGPLAPFQQIGGSFLRRMQGAFSGPNQLGIWMLIPFGIILSRLLSSGWQQRKRKDFVLHALAFILVALSILLSFSRAACIAAFAVTLLAFWKMLPRQQAKKSISWIIGVGVALGIMLIVITPSVALRLASSRDHLIKPMQALQTMAQHPLGLGLGSAGPASNRVSDACVFLEQGADASWAKSHPDLCVFIDSVQVQPPLPIGAMLMVGEPYGRVCHCAFLPENWYLQIGVEMGWMGLILYVLLVMLIVRSLLAGRENYAALVFIAVSIAALFLHAWEDAAVAYTVWMVVAVAFSIQQNHMRFRV